MSNSVKADSWFPRFLPAYTLSGASPAVTHKVVAASQTIYKGDPITVAYTTGKASLGLYTSAAWYGIAAHDVATTASDEGYDLEIWVANDDTVFVGQANAASSTLYPGLLCDTATSGSGSTKTWKLDYDGTTYKQVTIVDYVPGDSKTDSTDPGRVYFTIGKSQYTQRTTSQV
jgi:hypothetical protein